jgi:hypothetical protein
MSSTQQTINPSLYQKSISVSSGNKDTGTQSSFSQTIKLPPNNTFTKVSLLHASIPKGWYMLDEQIVLNVAIDSPSVGNESLFPLVWNGPRNFTLSELITELNLSTGPTVGVWSYDQTRGKLSFAPASGGTFRHALFYQLDSKTEQADNVIKYLGFPEGSYTPTDFTDLNDLRRMNLQRYCVVNLHASICDNSGDDVLAELYMAGTGSNDVFEYRTPDACMSSRGISNNDINQLRVSLTDKNGKEINMNGLDWCSTIVCYDDRVHRERC